MIYKQFLLSVLLCLLLQPSSASSPLILTSYIESGQVDKARNLSLVTRFKPNIPSYSGFITVDKGCNSNLWFWFFPSRNKPDTDPVMVWLSGGPGLSSMFGLFLENGPYVLLPSGELKLRKHSWTANSSVIYVDNPVGTGFSFASRPSVCYSRNQNHIAQNFLEFLNQFFLLFESYKSNPLYLFGESFGGKYVTGIAYALLKSNTTLRLEGIGIGNGVIDPRTQEVYAANLYQLGIIDDKMKNHILRKETLIRYLIDQKKFSEASEVRAKLFRRHRQPTGYQHWYNYMESKFGRVFHVDYDAFLRRGRVRRALHVGNAIRNDDYLVRKMLSEEMMQSVRPWFEYVIERRRTLLYYGQMDLVVSYAGATNFIKSMNWSGAEAFGSKPRTLWEVRGKLAGYIKSEGLFTEVLVRNAGHNVPVDQPVWALNLYKKFIFKQIGNSDTPTLNASFDDHLNLKNLAKKTLRQKLAFMGPCIYGHCTDRHSGVSRYEFSEWRPHHADCMCVHLSGGIMPEMPEAGMPASERRSLL